MYNKIIYLSLYILLVPTFLPSDKSNKPKVERKICRIKDDDTPSKSSTTFTFLQKNNYNFQYKQLPDRSLETGRKHGRPMLNYWSGRPHERLTQSGGSNFVV